MTDDSEDFDMEELKAKLEALPNQQKAALMAPALIYIGRALDEFGQLRAAIKVAEAALILVGAMDASNDEDRKDQEKTIIGLHYVIDKLKNEANQKKEH